MHSNPSCLRPHLWQKFQLHTNHGAESSEPPVDKNATNCVSVTDHIRSLTESFDSKLAGAGNPLVRQLGRYLTEGRPKSPEAQAKGGDGQQAGRGRPRNGHQVDQTNRAQQSSVGRFSATPTEVLP
jgi:hypothetical protein